MSDPRKPIWTPDGNSQSRANLAGVKEAAELANIWLSMAGQNGCPRHTIIAACHLTLGQIVALPERFMATEQRPPVTSIDGGKKDKPIE